MKVILFGILLIGMSQSFGQKKQKITIQSLSDIKIDADLREWGVLDNVADEGLWFYQLAQDVSNIYIAVRVEDGMLQNLVARNGILFSLSATRKNREDIQFLFPYPDNEVKRAMMSEDRDPGRDDKTTLINRSRGYFVKGFPTVPPGLLSLQNSYGLHATARMDNEVLYYEAVIPKALLDYTKPVATLKLAINDGFSTFVPADNRTPDGSGGMRGPHRGKSAPAVKNKLTMTVLLETTID